MAPRNRNTCTRCSSLEAALRPSSPAGATDEVLDRHRRTTQHPCAKSLLETCTSRNQTPSLSQTTEDTPHTSVGYRKAACEHDRTPETKRPCGHHKTNCCSRNQDLYEQEHYRFWCRASRRSASPPALLGKSAQQHTIEEKLQFGFALH
ncbi:hypothetical protein SLA2020_016880 [Shorea laevis]